MRNVKVVIWGFGAMGSGMAKMLLTKKGIDVVGVCDRHPDRVGKSMFEVLGIDKGDRADVIVGADIDKMLTKGSADVCLCATDSYTKAAFPRLKYVLEQGVNVISTAEEMSYPKAKSPVEAAELHRIAKENGVSIVGTGINPGLMMDLLALTLSGAMIDLESVMCKRVNSLSPFGEVVMEEQGVGISKDEFDERFAKGELAGHVGFAESIGMIAEGIGWEVEKFEQQMKPIITNIDRKSPHGFAGAGTLAGVNMTGQGYIDGEVKIDMIHPQQIEPELEGVATGDYIVLKGKGTPDISMSITPEVEGGLGTIAMCVNMIPHIINARPGLKTMIDLPSPRAIMGDVRRMLEIELN